MFFFLLTDLTRLGVWVLDGDPGHSNLLKFALNESNYAHTLVILMVSMTTPWSWQDQLQHWIKLLAEHVDTLKIDADVRKQAEQRLVAAWQNYCETGDDLDPNSPMSKPTLRLPSVDEDDVLPLPDEVLTRNLGLDIVVVVSKVGNHSSVCQAEKHSNEPCCVAFLYTDRLYGHIRKGIQLSR